jgi:hypothetical protein
LLELRLSACVVSLCVVRWSSPLDVEFPSPATLSLLPTPSWLSHSLRTACAACCHPSLSLSLLEERRTWRHCRSWRSNTEQSPPRCVHSHSGAQSHWWSTAVTEALPTWSTSRSSAVCERDERELGCPSVVRVSRAAGTERTTDSSTLSHARGRCGAGARVCVDPPPYPTSAGFAILGGALHAPRGPRPAPSHPAP